MFAFLIRHRYWTLGAVIALMAASLVFAFATDGASFDSHAKATDRGTSATGTASPVGTIQDQLTKRGYVFAGASQYDSSDAHRTINYQTWQAEGRPTVYLTDAYPGKAGSYVIDTVVYDSQTLGYLQFWCVPPSLTDAANLAVTLNAAAAERTNVESGTHKPVSTSVPHTDKSVGATLCYMK